MSSQTDNKSTIPKRSEAPATLSDFIADGKNPDYKSQVAKPERFNEKSADQNDEGCKDLFDHSSPPTQGRGREGMIANNETRDFR